MGRVVNTREDAVKWLEDTESFNGNSCLSESQAKALSDWLDGLQELINVHEIHGVYIMGVLETAKIETYEYMKGCIEKVMDLAGMEV